MASATAGLTVPCSSPLSCRVRTPVFHRWELFQLREASKATATCVAAAVCLNCYMFISGRVLDRGGFGHLDRAFPDRDFPYQDFPLRDCLDQDFPVRDSLDQDCPVRDFSDQDCPVRDSPDQDCPVRDCLDLGYSALPDRYVVRYPFFDFVLSVAAAVIGMECKSN